MEKILSLIKCKFHVEQSLLSLTTVCDVIKLSVLKEHFSPRVLKGSYSWLFDLTELSVYGYSLQLLFWYEIMVYFNKLDDCESLNISHEPRFLG